MSFPNTNRPHAIPTGPYLSLPEPGNPLAFDGQRRTGRYCSISTASHARHLDCIETGVGVVASGEDARSQNFLAFVYALPRRRQLWSPSKYESLPSS
jgi:hypothetical protein